MDSKGFQGGQYRPLSQEQLETIHNASLQILETIGMGFEEGLDDTAKMLAQNGAEVDFSNRRIKFPRNLIEKEIEKAPSKVVLHGRDTQHDLDLTEDKVHLGTGGAAIKILDIENIVVVNYIIKT